MNTRKKIADALKRLDYGKRLQYGLDISIENCEINDFLYACFSTKCSSIPNGSIVRIAEAIEVAYRFEGKWCIAENGQLIRYDSSIEPKDEPEEFHKVGICAVSPECNIGALQCFGEMISSKKYTKVDHLVHLSCIKFIYRIAVDECGFYLLHIREKFN